MSVPVDDFSEIFAKTPGRIKPGLSRMTAALRQLGHPEREGRNILVAGTNGKGTTSSFLWQLCRQTLTNDDSSSHGDSPAVSLFSSPHLVQFRERYLFSRSRISHQQLKDQLAILKDKLGAAYEPLSFFEVATLLGFSLFSQLKAKERIWEVGLGGRWDCTNTVAPDLAVIVSIDLDHQEFLGDTIEQVLKEKLGVARPDKPLLLGNCPNLQSAPLIALCREASAQLLQFGQHYGYSSSQQRREGFLHLPGQARSTFPVPAELQGKPDYLIDNFILAVAAYAVWRGQQAKSPAQLVGGINWPALWAMPGFFGRSQQLTVQGQPLLWDVCHNVAGARAFAASVAKRYPSRKPAGLISILADKDIPAIIAELERAIDIRGFYHIDHPRSPRSAENLPEAISTFDSFAEAWNSRQSWLAPHQTREGIEGEADQPLVICGSVLAIGVAMAQLADVSVEISRLWHFDRFIDP